MNNQEKICPFMSIGEKISFMPCIAERCAWWDGHNCAMLTAANSLDGLNENGIIVWPEDENA